MSDRLNGRMKQLVPEDYKEQWGLWKIEELMSCPERTTIYI